MKLRRIYVEFSEGKMGIEYILKVNDKAIATCSPEVSSYSEYKSSPTITSKEEKIYPLLGLFIGNKQPLYPCRLIEGVGLPMGEKLGFCFPVSYARWLSFIINNPTAHTIAITGLSYPSNIYGFTFKTIDGKSLTTDDAIADFGLMGTFGSFRGSRTGGLLDYTIVINPNESLLFAIIVESKNAILVETKNT